jgi:PHD/YefM family antitoxin component YafN of YafNO toxin-antitoxin module
MQIISTREFRANQKKYFEFAEKELVLVARKNQKPVALYVPDDDDILSKEEFQAIQRGLDDVRNGRTIKIKNSHDIWADIL